MGLRSLGSLLSSYGDGTRSALSSHPSRSIKQRYYAIKARRDELDAEGC
jgi:hypothetical protein